MDETELKALQGKRVRAMTLPSEEHERPARAVMGILHLHPVPALNGIQCWVDGTQVDEATVVSEEDRT